MSKFIRFLFFGVIARFVGLIVLGLNVRHRERLPRAGPCIVIANHNSHLDTITLMTLLPLKLLPKVHPVAAADYFLRNRLLAWFALQVIGIVPINRERKRPDEDLLAPVREALARGDILIFFPEGSRGEPEQLTQFKSGIARLAEQFPAVPVVPIFMHGLGKSLPKGEAILVPFFIDVFVGEPLQGSADREGFMISLRARMDALAAEGHFPAWQ
ncbi:MAG TPA: lysophospholipid acyltransferase family protein [Steroidobacteraceae bacterium]|nr:lysophospholipid acyltransferase family protein [Steroidobacteraceae bacterium]